jgi:hypothetical protein
MHPELQRLDEQYRSLAADLQAGHISQEDAMMILASLTAVDGEGWVWSIDPYSGEFLRAMPDQTGSPADPSLFVVSRLPVVPVAVPPHGTPAEQVSDYLHPNLRPLPAAPMSERARSALSGVASNVAGGASSAARPLGGFLRKKGRTVFVLVGGLLLVGVLVTQRPGGEVPDSPSPGSVPTPTVPPPTIVIPGVDSVPSESTVAPVDVSTSVPTTLPPLPSDAELAALLELLKAGDAVVLASLLPESQRERLDMLGLLGAPRAGFQLSFSTPKVSGSNVLLQVRAGDPGNPVRRWNLKLRRSDTGSWAVVSVGKS